MANETDESSIPWEYRNRSTYDIEVLQQELRRLHAVKQEKDEPQPSPSSK